MEPPMRRVTRNNTRKIPNRNFAIVAAPVAIPVNPSMPAMMAITRNVTDHFNISILLFNWTLHKKRCHLLIKLLTNDFPDHWLQAQKKKRAKKKQPLRLLFSDENSFKTPQFNMSFVIGRIGKCFININHLFNFPVRSFQVIGTGFSTRLNF